MSVNTQIFLLDNLDSFTYNLVDQLHQISPHIQVFRNTLNANFIFEQIRLSTEQRPTMLVLSPGPGKPAQAGCMPALIKLSAGLVPILGICLGHQAIIEHFGGEICQVGDIVHGKSSLMHHCNDKIFAGLPNPMPVARYHSLKGTNIPEHLEVIARVDDIPMAVLNRTNSMLGLQFHPESILTTHGKQMLIQATNYLLHKEQKNAQ